MWPCAWHPHHNFDFRWSEPVFVCHITNAKYLEEHWNSFDKHQKLLLICSPNWIQINDSKTVRRGSVAAMLLTSQHPRGQFKASFWHCWAIGGLKWCKCPDPSFVSVGRALKWPRGSIWSQKHGCNMRADMPFAFLMDFCLHCFCFSLHCFTLFMFLLCFSWACLAHFSKMNESYKKTLEKNIIQPYSIYNIFRCLLCISGTCGNLTCIFRSRPIFLFHCLPLGLRPCSCWRV